MSENPAFALHRYDRRVLRVLGVIAVLITVWLLIDGVVHGIRALAPGETSLVLLTRHEVPHDREASTADGAAIVSAGFDTASVVASGLSGQSRGLLAVGAFATALTAAVVGGAIAWFLLLLAARRPFHRSLYLTALAAGFALVIGTLLSNGIGGFGRMHAATELQPLTDEVFLVGFQFDPLPTVVGFAVLAVAFVFRAGTRLQRDTEGLV